METISAAVVTRTPLVSVPVSVPTFVMKEPLLWNVPLTLPAVTVKMKSREVAAGRITPLKFQVIVNDNQPIDFEATETNNYTGIFTKEAALVAEMLSASS